MDKILEIKGNLLALFENNEKIMKPLLKFVLCFITVLILGISLGYNHTLANPIVMVVIGAVCAFLPKNIDVLILIVVLVGHMASLSMEIALVTVVLLLVMYFIYFRFAPKYAFVVILLPILFFIKIPFVVPLVLAVTATPITIIPTIFGVAIYYIVHYTSVNVAAVNAAEAKVDQVSLAVQAVFTNKECILVMVVFAAVIVCGYYIKRSTINNAPRMAVLIGAAINIVALLIGFIVIGNADILSIVFMIAGSIISVLLALLIQTAVLPLDYSKTVNTQFEDDEYYYYVKAVPKHSIAKEKVSVKKINRKK